MADTYYYDRDDSDYYDVDNEKGSPSKGQEDNSDYIYTDAAYYDPDNDKSVSEWLEDNPFNLTNEEYEDSLSSDSSDSEEEKDKTDYKKQQDEDDEGISESSSDNDDSTDVVADDTLESTSNEETSGYDNNPPESSYKNEDSAPTIYGNNTKDANYDSSPWNRGMAELSSNVTSDKLCKAFLSVFNHEPATRIAATKVKEIITPNKKITIKEEV